VGGWLLVRCHDRPTSVRFGALIAVAVTIAAGSASASQPGFARIDVRLERVLAAATSDSPVLAWVYFNDKGPAAAAKPAVSARSLARRAKVMSSSRTVDREDAPLYPPYVARVASRVERVRQQSRWFNAVSVEATPAQIRALSRLPEVRSLAVVAQFRRANSAASEALQEGAPAKPGRAAPHQPSGGLDYGLSLPQLQMLRVPELHQRGLSGKGVLIGHFDDGYRLLSHQVFAQLDVVHGHDFVDRDADPAPPPGLNAGEHGISTLSVLAGYAPGQLIGPAYGAQYALARTEDDASETPLEEDNWVAAMEWADSLGCDVVSSSLGYLEYDSGPSWTWQDMDGNTTVITRAADRAVARGIVVVTAAGNGGAATGGRGNTLNAPGDADSALTIGGVWMPPGTTEPEWYFTSSVGPTADTPPRVKPDLAAPGAAVYLAGTANETHYGYNSGTSFAAPLVAGVVALILEAQPGATPLEIRTALRATASRAAMPNNQIGWGVVDGVRALAVVRSPVVRRDISSVKRLYR
jgi:hypothetical protein